MDVGAMTNGTNAAANTYTAKETKKTEETKKYNVLGKTVGEPKLSEKAKKYYEELKSKYKNMDFILVSSDKQETAKKNAASYASDKNITVLIGEDEIERMAEDEECRKQYEGVIASAQNQLSEIKKSIGGFSNVKGFGIQLNEDGTTSFFAVMKKSSDSQTERLEEKKAEKKEEKKAEKKKREEQLEEKRLEKTESDDVIVTANSIEELKKKIEEYQYSYMADHLKTDAEKKVGTVIDFKG